MKDTINLTEEQQEVFKTFLTTADLKEIAKIADVSSTTLYNIVRGNYGMNVRTKSVEKVLNVALYKKLKATIGYAEVQLKKLEDLPEIEDYLLKEIEVNA